MEVIQLTNLPYIDNNEKLNGLKRLFRLHTELMPHQLSFHAQCTYDQACELVIYLYMLDVGELFISIYDRNDPEIAFKSISFDEGKPKLPLLNPNNDSYITDYSQIAYDLTLQLSKEKKYEFKLK